MTVHLAFLPFIGNVDLNNTILCIFIFCVLAVICFEFVNGFHDTANAVATVIYTKALTPKIAIPWSGLWNFLGIITGGITVAMGILKLVPIDSLMALPVNVGACLVLAILIAAIAWNLGTWYLGIPCSSSHTMIGAMIGGGLAFTWYYGGAGVNWGKAEEIGLSLIISPIIGFGLASLLMLFLKHIVKSKSLFHIPTGANDKPPFFVRGLLVTTCALVSFFHGSNDGQKGIGLMMLVLIVFLPAKYAINHEIPTVETLHQLDQTEKILELNATKQAKNQVLFNDIIANIKKARAHLLAKNETDKANSYQARKGIEAITKSVKELKTNPSINLSETDKKQLNSYASSLKELTEFAPMWVVLIVSISLALGTMIGWKRIVVTIGEKIGNEHLNYAQGASSEIVAASTIGLSTAFGLPVSTTHVLSSAIAGSMVASGGTKNLNNNTLKNIGIAWLLTLPVSIVLAALLFMLFHLFL